MTYDPRAIVAQNLSLYRKQKGYKQKDVSAATGIDNSTLSKYESGAREPDLSTIVKLADHYGVTFLDIVGGEPNKEQIIDEETQRIMNLLNSLSDSERETALAMLFGLEYKLRLEQSKSRNR